MFWSLLQNVGGRGITFIVMIILARLLTPEAFGLIGMLMIFIQVSQTLIIAGFGKALIQKKSPDENDYSSVFWINLAISILLYVVIFYIAPLIADFYNQPSLVKLTRVLSIVFVINSFSYVQETRLIKKMNFKTLTIIHIPSTILGGIISVFLAMNGYGVWSIVALQLVTRFFFTIQLWIYAKWKPLLFIDFYRVKKLFSFGGKLMLSEIINTIYRNVYLVVLGKFFPLASVGYYQNANNMVQYPASSFTGALASVSFPAFSSIQDDNKKLKEVYKKIIQQLIFWLSPIVIMAGILGEPLFRFIFTEKWLPAVPYFQLLCVIGILWPLNVFSLNIINIKGRSDITLKLELVKKILITISLLISVPLGIWAVIILQVVNSFMGFLLNSHFSAKYLSYPLNEQLKDILPVLLLCSGLGLLIFISNYYLQSFSDLIRTISGFGIGGLFYWIGASNLKIEPYLYFRELYRAKFKF